MSKELSFNVFDTETTGIDPLDGHKIIEIALLRFNMSGVLLDKYVQRIDPQRPIDAKAQEVHGISYEELAHCPVFADVAASIDEQIRKGDFIVAHNLTFDASFLAVEFNACGRELVSIPSVDTIDARWATYNGKLPNLGELCFALGIDYDPSKAHGAEYDVMVTAQAFLEGHRRGHFVIPEKP